MSEILSEAQKQSLLAGFDPEKVAAQNSEHKQIQKGKETAQQTFHDQVGSRPPVVRPPNAVYEPRNWFSHAQGRIDKAGN